MPLFNPYNITAWTSYTPTGSWTTNTTYAGKWRRIGVEMEVQVQINTSGAPTAGTLTVNIPSGYSIDTASLVNSGADTQLIDSTGSIYEGGEITLIQASVYSTTSVFFRCWNTTLTYLAHADVGNTTPITFGAGDYIVCTFRVPIVGWGA